MNEMQYRSVGKLSVAEALHDFIEAEALPGTGIAPVAFWYGLAALIARSRPAQPGSARAVATGSRARSTSITARAGGSPSRPQHTSGSCARSATSCPSRRDFAIAHRKCRRRDRPDRRPAARRAGLERPLRAQRRQCPLGQPLRRALRHRRDPRGRRRRRGAPATTRRAASASSRGRAPSSTRRRRWPTGRATPTRPPTRSRAARSRSRSRTAGGPGSSEPGQFVGYRGDAARAVRRAAAPQRPAPRDRDRPASPIGRTIRPASPTSCSNPPSPTIMDLEDSVAAVDADDKVAGLPQLARPDERHADRELREGRPHGRAPAQPRPGLHARRTAASSRLHGRSLMLVRNVGHHMYTDAVLDASGAEVPEGIARRRRDGARSRSTTCAAPQDCATAAPARSTSSSRRCTGRTRSPSRTSCSAASRTCSGCPATRSRWASWTRSGARPSTSRRCIRAAADRVVFINTGFLDRTGDEIHTSIEAGADDPQERHEDARPGSRPTRTRNVDIGLACGLPGEAQIGKGMWAVPDRMADMLAQKIAHPQAGANTAWVPSPTAATLHALHYHQVDVAARQRELAVAAAREAVGHPDDPGLAVELGAGRRPAGARQQRQGILGYVVRWIDQGVGCSKVPDIHDVGPDGGPRDPAHLEPAHRQLAPPRRRVARSRCWRPCSAWPRWSTGRTPAIPAYRPMAPGFDGPAFQAACDLVFEGTRAAERLHRMDPPRPPPRGQGPGRPRPDRDQRRPHRLSGRLRRPRLVLCIPTLPPETRRRHCRRLFFAAGGAGERIPAATTPARARRERQGPCSGRIRPGPGRRAGRRAGARRWRIPWRRISGCGTSRFRFGRGGTGSCATTFAAMAAARRRAAAADRGTRRRRDRGDGRARPAPRPLVRAVARRHGRAVAAPPCARADRPRRAGASRGPSRSAGALGRAHPDRRALGHRAARRADAALLVRRGLHRSLPGAHRRDAPDDPRDFDRRLPGVLRGDPRHGSARRARGDRSAGPGDRGTRDRATAPEAAPPSRTRSRGRASSAGGGAFRCGREAGVFADAVETFLG